MSHNCEIYGCTAVIADDKLMCHAHWKLVPDRIQRLVSSSWSAIRQSKKQEARDQANRRYRQARQQALDAVHRMGPLL